MAALALLHSFFMSNLAVKYPPTLEATGGRAVCVPRDGPFKRFGAPDGKKRQAAAMASITRMEAANGVAEM